MIALKKAGTVAILVLGAVSAVTSTQAKEQKSGYYKFNQKGELVRPDDYRSWVFAGTGTTPKALDPNVLFPDFQNVYIDPVGYRFWKQNGYFRDGTIFVKELIRKGETNSPVGTGFFQGEAYSLSITVKDSKRYPDAPGGWQYFKFADYEKGVLTKTSAALGGGCIACHASAKAGHGPFVELYMPMRDAKGFGKGSPENLDTRPGLMPKMPEHLRAKE